MARPSVAGYCWPQSVVAGDSFGVHLSATTGSIAVEIARDGAVREVVFRGEVTVDDQPVTTRGSTDGCDWPAALTIDVDATWGSGYYEVLLTGESDGRVVVGRAFVVAPPATSARRAPRPRHQHVARLQRLRGHEPLQRRHAGLAAAPDGSGLPLQAAGSGAAGGIGQPSDPYLAAHIGYLTVNRLSSWAGSAGWPNWEKPFVAWAEGAGYELDVATSADLDAQPDLLARYRLMLSVGHDEYWSAPMRDAVESFIGDGGNVAFLSGNTSFWQVRLEDEGRTMVGSSSGSGTIPVTAPTGRARSRACGRTETSAVPRTP
ncbi:MAG: N,N-dimethylformamidase beta subunit family domain-containing protein [Acidimicrobiales bacterium]